MALGNFLSNQGTQTGIIVDTIGTSVMAVQKLDISSIGTDGTLWNGNVGVTGGTINTLGTLPNLLGGTLTNLASGTINSATVTGNIGVSSGTINVSTISTLPNIPGGSIVVTAGTMVQTTGTINLGTIVGKDANAVAQTANPIGIGGTDSGGTIRTLLIDSGGNANINLSKYAGQSFNFSSEGDGVGTSNVLIKTMSFPRILNSSTVWELERGANASNGGTGLGLPAAAALGTDSGGTYRTIKVDSGGLQRVGLDSGTVSVLPNIPGGTLNNLVSGTINSATVVLNTGTISVLPNLPQGSINVTAGTFVGNGGSIGANGMGANAVVAVGNPVRIGGTDSGGTTYGFLTDTTGHMKNDIITGTINAATVVLNSGTINLGTFVNNGGTVAVVQNAGTLQVGANIIGNIGTLVTGTILSSGTSTGVGTMTNLGSVTNLGQVYNAGTIQNILGGTIQQNPLPPLAMPTFGTHGTTGVSIFGTLAGGTNSGAGTEIFVTSVSLTIPSTGGSQDVSIGWGTNGGTFHAGTGLILRGNFPPGGGIQKTFSPAINSGTNAQLCYFQAGAGTVDISTTYFTTTSTL